MNVTTPIDSKTARATGPDQDAHLLAVDTAVFIVDPASFSVVAANAVALAALGFEHTSAATLDPAMPASGAIRAFASAAPSAYGNQQALLFWTPSGPRAYVVNLELVPRPAQTLVRVIFASATTIPVVTASRRSADELPSVHEKDLATLSEIARRIRAGSAAARAALANMASNPVDEDDIIRPPALDFQPVPFDALTPPERVPELSAVTVLPQDLVAKLAHELRTPLSAIVSLAEIMRDERLGAMGNPRYRAYASDIYDSASHTIQLIGDVLDANRCMPLGGDRVFSTPLAITPVDLNEIGRSCVSSMQPMSEHKGVKLTAQLASGLPLVLADRRAMRQIMLNVLSNAMRFTSRGGSIFLSTKHSADGTVTLSIADTGAGMRATDIARAMAQADLAQADLAQADLAKGDLAKGDKPMQPAVIQVAGGHHHGGIGLPLVRNLVEAHGGRLLIDSTIGIGTRIAMIFPMEKVQRS